MPERGRSAKRSIVTEGSARVGPFMTLPSVLKELGADPQAILAEFGLTPDDFDDPENTMSFHLVGRLFRRCSEATKCENLGLVLGQRATTASLGAVGFLMQSSATVGDALRGLSLHLGVQDRGAMISLESDGTLATIAYTILVRDVEAVEQIYTLASLIGNGFISAMCGPAWRAHEIQLPFRRPADIMAYRQAYEAPLRFDADRAAIVFAANTLARELATADPLLNRMMKERIAEMETVANAGLVEKARNLLGTMIFVPNCSPSLLARRLGLAMRTMNRRLADDGTSYQQLRDEVCMTAARQLLTSTKKPANEIGQMLGYSDATAFTRAFRRWSGMPPAQWRASRHR